MKKLMAMLLLAGSIQGVYAQKTEKKEMFLENKSLYEELTNVQKKTDKFNLYLNMQGSFDANFRDGFDEGVFKMRQLRIEARQPQQLALLSLSPASEPFERGMRNDRQHNRLRLT